MWFFSAKHDDTHFHISEIWFHSSIIPSRIIFVHFIAELSGSSFCVGGVRDDLLVTALEEGPGGPSCGGCLFERVLDGQGSKVALCLGWVKQPSRPRCQFCAGGGYGGSGRGWKFPERKVLRERIRWKQGGCCHMWTSPTCWSRELHFCW